ncbi:MAG: hypothetical protein ABW061_02340 [Polyangiaceae bacterium]
MHRVGLFGCLLLSSLATGCAPSAPPRWVEGGAPLAIAPAHWERADDDAVDIQPDGRVLEGGHLRFVVDRVGRVTDDDYEAFAVLLPDGHVVGTDERPLGYVGMSNATPPFSDHAWLSLQRDGRVVRYEPNGDRSEHGKWTGCDGPNRRTCTLVTQIFAMRNYRAVPAGGVGFGVGVGVGIGF